jgi:hypothetical protein
VRMPVGMEPRGILPRGSGLQSFFSRAREQHSAIDLCFNCAGNQMARLKRRLAQNRDAKIEREPVLYLKRGKRVLINLFIGFHIVAIACWCVPLDLPLLSSCKELIRPYFLWSGLFQSWDTFAPTPWGLNSYVEATLIYKDGSQKTWAFPRMEQLSPGERYIEERYRKFAEILQNDGSDALWPDVARRIARLNSTPLEPVKTVVLIQKWSLIVPRADGSYRPEPWEQHVLFGYGVRPGDLQ